LNSGSWSGLAPLGERIGCAVAWRRLHLRDTEGPGRATLDKLETATQRYPEIVGCYLLASPADRDAADFERMNTRILTRLPGVMRVQSALALRTVKRTTALPI